jgi:hypothetical protein
LTKWGTAGGGENPKKSEKLTLKGGRGKNEFAKIKRKEKNVA